MASDCGCGGKLAGLKTPKDRYGYAVIDGNRPASRQGHPPDSMVFPARKCAELAAHNEPGYSRVVRIKVSQDRHSRLVRIHRKCGR